MLHIMIIIIIVTRISITYHGAAEARITLTPSGEMGTQPTHIMP